MDSQVGAMQRETDCGKLSNEITLRSYIVSIIYLFFCVLLDNSCVLHCCCRLCILLLNTVTYYIMFRALLKSSYLCITDAGDMVSLLINNNQLIFNNVHSEFTVFTPSCDGNTVTSLGALLLNTR